MKILSKNIIEKNKSGFISLLPEEDDDIYSLYNLIIEGDIIEAKTIRNVVKESKSGDKDKKRIQLKIAIKVEKVEFDPDKGSLRINGKNTRENEHIKLGQYHTLEILKETPVKLEKEYWDLMQLEIIDEISDLGKSADVAALVMQEGLANLCLIKSTLTKNCACIKRHLPKKKLGNSSHDKALEHFFDEIYQAIVRYIDFELIKVFLLGSPGTLKDDFFNYFINRATKEENSSFLKNKSKFLRAHSSSGFKRAIEEILSQPEILSSLGEVKAMSEVKILEDFHNMLSRDPDRACYGAKEVFSANDQLAISDLLISDNMFRSKDFAERAKFIGLIESVRENGGRVFKFSSLHISGEQLNMYTGIAAILRFPIPEVYSENEEDEDSD